MKRLFIFVLMLMLGMGVGCKQSEQGHIKEVNFTISELGIALALPSDLKDDLAYVVGNEVSNPLVPDENENIVISFNSKKLSKQAEQVNMHCGFVGEIVKTKKLQQILIVNGKEQERESIVGLDYKVGDYYISFYSPREGCASLDDQTLIKNESSIIKALKDSIAKALQ